MKAFKTIFTALLLAFAFGTVSAQAADKTPLTPEFCEEGITKAVDVFNEMAVKIGEIDKPEQVEEIPQIVNSIKYRNVRKKYGKIELTDEYRARLLEPNLRIAQALKDMMVRLQLPYQAVQMLEEQASPEKSSRPSTSRKLFETPWSNQHSITSCQIRRRVANQTHRLFFQPIIIFPQNSGQRHKDLPAQKK